MNTEDNVYIGIKGWEDDDDDECDYGSSDDDYSSDTYDYDTNLSGHSRNSWVNFDKNDGSDGFVDCGSESNDDWYKVEVDVWWNYTVPPAWSFSLGSVTGNSFRISRTGTSTNYRYTRYYYVVDNNSDFSSPVASSYFTGTSVDIAGLSSNTRYYVKVRGYNEGGYGNYSSSQNTTTDTKPTVTSNTVSDIGETTATCGGNVTATGGATVTAKGVYYSTSDATPDSNDESTVDGSGTGSYTSNITGLSPGTFYYVRAYAINAVGTSYGAVRTFTTLPDAATNIFPENSSTDMPRTVTISWRYDGLDTPTGFKVYHGAAQVGSNILWAGDILYNQALNQADWEDSVVWRVVPYNTSGDCSIPIEWTYDVMADPGGTPPSEAVYYELEEVTVTEPPTMTLPTITLGGEDIQPTVDFTFDSAPASFTLTAIVQDQPDNPVPNPENCGGALFTNLPTGNPTRIIFYFSTSVTPNSIYHLNGSFWENITGSSNPVFSLGQVEFDWTSVTRGDEEFAVNNGDGPLPVTLSAFTASFSNSSSLLSWTTQSENNNLGWNVYRSETESTENYLQINQDMIEGAGTTTEQTDYTFADQNEVYPNYSYWYWIESVDNGGTTALHGPARIDIPDNEDELPPELLSAYGLAQNYPNPFNPNTKIAFKLKAEDIENAELIIYNSRGQKVKIFTNLMTGENEIGHVDWDGTDSEGNAVSSGIYMYKMKAGGRYTSTKKMILLK